MEEGRLQRASQEQVDYLGKWLVNAEGISEAVPIIKQTHHQALAQQKAFGAIPSGFNAGIFANVASMIELNNAFLKASVPLPPAVNLTACSSGFALVASAGTAAIPLLNQLAAAPDSATRNWVSDNLGQFIQLNTKASNISFILQRLKRIWPPLAVEFQDAVTLCDRARSGTADYPSAAFAMRNVLESLNGNMLDLARKRPGANRVKKWADAAGYIARGAPSSPETARLVGEAVTYETLKEQLTRVGKRDLTATGPDLEAMYATFVGLLFTTCSLVHVP